MGGTLSKNGKDQHQDREILDMRERLDKHDTRFDQNDGDHAKIMEMLSIFQNERSWGKWVMAFIVSGVAWFMVITLQHIWSGERWGNEMRHDIDQNSAAIDRLRDRE